MGAVHGMRPDDPHPLNASVRGGRQRSARGRATPDGPFFMRARSAAVRQRRPNARITVWCTALPAASSALALSDT